jgi:hypothetical protein
MKGLSINVELFIKQKPEKETEDPNATFLTTNPT